VAAVGAAPAARVLLTGSTGYVGGRLLQAFEARGTGVRCLVRDPARVERSGALAAEYVRGDVLDPAALARALAGIEVAYYLIHSMAAVADYGERDRRAARAFALAAREAGVRRIVYLGGLGRGPGLSEHLASRQEVGRILRESGVPTLEFRASVVVGRGSLSFEMVRALVERLPVMITPRWVRTPTQPIGIDDVVAYLLAALDLPGDASVVYEIGGADRTSYMFLMREYARQRGLRRLMLPVPVLTPRLSSLWLGLVTPVQAMVGRRLLDGVRNETVVRDDRALRDFDIVPIGVAAAVRRALEEGPPPSTSGLRLTDVREATVPVPPSRAFAPILRIGGDTGWYYGDALWRLRGLADRLLGGVGLRRGRSRPVGFAPGDLVDCWRVEAFEPDHLVRFAADMKVPGEAWLQFEVEGDDRASVIRQTATFLPRGLAGRAYWYGLAPIHEYVFSGMLRGIVRAVGPA
jgi:uncharacterized protein YbjT (DUF2867 family)